MALPTILVNSATGSDTQASGAGPSTALFGTTDASTDGAGTTVTLTAGTDLTNVATDGSHVIFLNDTTAGARNFGKITGKAGSGGATPTVTVANAFGLSLSSKSWAIGGKRASIGSTTSRKLVENNGTTGDALAGWVVECESGHTEALTAALNIRVTGNTTDGMFTFRGASGTRPVLSFNINSGCISLRNAKILIHGFELKNTNATKTTSAGVEMLGSASIVRDMKIDDATDKFANGVTIRDSGGLVDRCRVGNCAGVGIVGTITSFLRSRIIGCTVFACGSHGVALNGDFVALTLAYNLLYGNAGDGINIDADAGDISRQWTILGNTIDGNTGDGIEIANDLATPTLIINNLLTNNGGYGLKLSHASATATYVAGSPIQIYNNNTYGNTSGAYLPTGAGSADPGLDPSYVNAAAGDFTPQTAGLEGTAFPTTIGAATSYGWPGVVQPQDTGGGSTLFVSLQSAVILG